MHKFRNCSAGGITVDWTLGEPVIETLTGANNILTRGMHQSKLTVTNLDDIVIPGLGISVYPNPTNDLLKIEVISQGNELLSYELFDINGRKLVIKKMRSNSEEIDMSSYPSGYNMTNIRVYVISNPVFFTISINGEFSSE